MHGTDSFFCGEEGWLECCMAALYLLWVKVIKRRQVLMGMNEFLNESVACTTYECNVQNMLVNFESNLSQYTKKMFMNPFKTHY